MQKRNPKFSLLHTLGESKTRKIEVFKNKKKHEVEKTLFLAKDIRKCVRGTYNNTRSHYEQQTRVTEEASAGHKLGPRYLQLEDNINSAQVIARVRQIK